jgi:hypothetical protein
MNRILYLGIAAFLISAAQPAFAWGTKPPKKTIFCDNSKDPEELTGEINANIVVLAGKSCAIDSALIKGNITAKPDAVSLDIEGSFIKGSIVTDTIDNLYINRTTVTGSVKSRDLQVHGEFCDSNFLGKVSVLEAVGVFNLGDVNALVLSPETTTPADGGTPLVIYCMGNQFLKDVKVAETDPDATLTVADNNGFADLLFLKNEGWEYVMRNDFENIFCKHNDPAVKDDGSNDVAKNGKNTCEENGLKPHKK